MLECGIISPNLDYTIVSNERQIIQAEKKVQKTLLIQMIQKNFLAETNTLLIQFDLNKLQD